MAIKFVQSEVQSNQKLNYKFNLLRFRLKNKDLKSFSFKAGQFILVALEDSLFRAYSIASPPKQLPIWEILIDITPNGPGCKYLKSLKAGDIIKTSTPKGVFALESDGASNIVMGATGCGLASIKPIIEEILEQGKSICFFWGLRHEEDMFDKSFLENWKKLNPEFEYEIILSKPENGWTGNTGHINYHMIEHIKSLSQKTTSVYLCGNSKMIADVKSSLEKINFPTERIYFERHY